MKIEVLSRPQLDYRCSFLQQKQETCRDDQLCGPDAEVLVEFAGRICYDSYDGKGRSSARYHEHILDVNHGSVTEHAHFSFVISGVSRSFLTELTRHRHGNFSVRSTRYVDESQSGFIDHPALKNYFKDQAFDEPDSRVVSTCVAAELAMNKAYEIVFEEVSKYLESKGVDSLTAKKQARGAARQYLGNGLETELVWTSNIRELRHVIQMRGDKSADGEMRLFAAQLLELCQKEAPAYFKDFVVSEGSDGMPVVELKQYDLC